jgi:FkbM family methyltransferase
MYGLKRSLYFTVIELYRLLFSRLCRGSYAQNGEDIVIDRILNRKDKVSYVDVGANEACRFSNTMRFYKRGGRGINIEPNSDLFDRLKKMRSRDINLHMGVSDRKGTLTFYRFFPHTVSTFSALQAEEYKRQGFRFIGDERVEVDTLSQVIERYFEGKTPDFFSIDTEGFNMEVLRGNDWGRYSPTVICIENSEDGKDREFLLSRGYEMVCDNGINSIYRKKRNGA